MMNKRDKIYNVYKAEFELVKEQSTILKCSTTFRARKEQNGHQPELL